MLTISIHKYIYIFLIGYFAANIITPLLIHFAHQIGMMDKPSSRRIHKNPTPRGGGIAIFVGFHLTCITIFTSTWHHGQYLKNGIIDFDWWLNFLVVSSLLLIIGIVDDIKNLRAAYKLCGQILVASCMFFLNVRIGAIFGYPLPIGLDYCATIIWFIAITNAFNLIDGFDGVATGLAAISALGIAGSFFFRHLPLEALMLVGFIGSCIGFLRYNFPPARIFLGDSGSMFLGFTLASLTLTTASKGTGLAAIWVPILALGIPIFDTLLAIWRRMTRKALAFLLDKRILPGIMAADLEHLHHRLMKVGLTPRNVTASLYLANSVLVLVGLMSLFFYDSSLAIFITTFVIATYIILRYVARVELWDSGMVIVLGLKNKSKPVVRSIAYVILDLLGLTLALLLTIRIVEPTFFSKGSFSIFQLPLPSWTVIPCLALLCIDPYRKLWSKDRTSVAVQRVLWCLAGIVLILGFVLLDIIHRQNMMLVGVLFSGLLFIFWTSTRVIPQEIEAYMIRKEREKTD